VCQNFFRAALLATRGSIPNGFVTGYVEVLLARAAALRQDPADQAANVAIGLQELTATIDAPRTGGISG